MRFDAALDHVPLVAKEVCGSSDLTRQHDHVGRKEATTRGSRVVEALQPAGRKRKGSLRQGLLGKNMLRRGPQEDHQPSTPPPPPAELNNTNMADPTPEEETTPRPASYQVQDATRNLPPGLGWKPTAASSVSESTTRSSSYEFDEPKSGMLASAIARSAAPYASTTDDDEAVPFYRSSTAREYEPSSPAAASAVLHRRPNRAIQHTSLSAVQSPTDLALEEGWDYSETEWWGWIILIGTWIVFVVGMGSCLGVWSWAWDVGETPYAPPELEDDDTLPITGYYPALIICTAVMAWVWVVVAWVGMKYFRHSKMVGDEC
ncbi:hypothetical protein PMIN01_02601 [Paraphaeosphaeria minitans]|uniref:Uncharacterized protein n=1 Tax=Paraphaeosphaeria minitans TaxID=565426 RepID=A0A9P6GRB3_9PLEO|nr:hypothetical protein PMIN01_02601 [Paraphaeosphaeria minitans]